MELIIKTAIENKQLLSFEYKGKQRVVEPYTFGESNTRKDTLSAFQIDGGTTASGQECWRQFPIRQIKNLKLLDEKFENVREDYDPENARLSFVYWTV